MKELVPLLEKLAEKLGTTTEYLWKVLIKQAPINSLIDLLQYLIIIVGCFIWWKYAKFTHKKVNDENWDDITYAGPAITGVILAILVIAMFFCLHTTIVGFLNPEYWALKYILNRIK